MFENIEKVLERYNQLNSLLTEPEVFNDPKTYTRYIKEKNDIELAFIPWSWRNWPTKRAAGTRKPFLPYSTQL